MPICTVHLFPEITGRHKADTAVPIVVLTLSHLAAESRDGFNSGVI